MGDGLAAFQRLTLVDGAMNARTLADTAPVWRPGFEV